MNTISRPCPVCGNGQLEDRKDKNSVTYEGVTRELDLFYAVCDSCGSEVGNGDHLRMNKRLMTAFKKEVDGLLTGAQIRAIRKKLQLSQSDAARIFGGGPVAFSKYETDDVTQSEAMDKLLRLASELPSAYGYLCKMAGVQTEAEPKEWIPVAAATHHAHVTECRVVEMFSYQARTRQVPMRLFSSTNDEFQPVDTWTPGIGGLSA